MRTITTWGVLTLMCAGGCLDGAELGTADEAIYGGTVVTSPTQFAAVARYDKDVDDSLTGRSWSPRCTATMITKTSALLAAHCFCLDDNCAPEIELNERRIYFDDPTTASPGDDCVGDPAVCDKWFVATKVLIHPDFLWDGQDGNVPHNDYAVMRFDRGMSDGRILELDQYTSVAPMVVNPTRMAVGQQGTMVGFGEFGPTNDECTSYDGIDSVKHVTTATLDNYQTFSPSGVNLVFNDAAHGVCHGDSGGPVIDPSGQLAGVASYKSGNSSLYDSADVAYPWLRQVACPHYDLLDPDAEQCTELCPCTTGEADCDSSAECRSGAVCALNVGKVASLPDSWDVCWGTTDAVRVYQGNSYTGSTQALPAASWTSAELATVGNDAISSLRVPAGMTARLCVEGNGGTPCQEYVTNTSAISGTIMDNVSYVRVQLGARLYSRPLSELFGQSAQTFKEGVYTSTQLTGVGDNTASALIANPGVSVMLCDGATGGGPCRELGGTNPVLPADIDNRTSYVAVRLGATLYENEDFAGPSQAFPVGTWTSASFTSISNDQVTSLVVAPGHSATLCHHASGVGPCVTYPAGWHSFVGFAMDDSTSWLRVQ